MGVLLRGSSMDHSNYPPYILQERENSDTRLSWTASAVTDSVVTVAAAIIQTT